MKKITLSDEQKKVMERAWFIFGNSGSKQTLGNHKLIQGFLECGEDRRIAYTENEPKDERYKVTEECLAAISLILSNHISLAYEFIFHHIENNRPWQEQKNDQVSW